MLLHKIENTHFSSSESVIIEYILEHVYDLETLTIQELADKTHTSAPLFIRLSKKLGYGGWIDFKKDFIKEIEYLNHETDIDASIPFTINDDIMKISNHLLQLEYETLKETHELLNHDDLQTALRLLRQSKVIELYGSGMNYLLAKEFALQLFYLGKHTLISQTPNDECTLAAMSDESHSAILISYSGETKMIKDVLTILKRKGVKTIGITCLADNTLSQGVDICLRLSSKEMLRTKIGMFSSTSSLQYLLNILYAGIFSFDYEKNLNYKIHLSQQSDQRISGFKYIDENNGNKKL